MSKTNTQEIQEKVNKRALLRIYRIFGRHYKKYWKTLSVAGLALLAGIATEMLRPWPLKLILDHVILDESLPANLHFLNPMLEDDPKLLLLILSVSIVLVIALESFFTYINKFWISSTGDRINADIRERVFAQLQRMSLSFHETSRSGNLVYLLTSDAKQMSSILIDCPQDLTHRLVTFAGYSILMLSLDWRLALIALTTVPFIYLATKYFSVGMKRAMTKMRSQEGELAAMLVENVNAMALVQAYGREDSEHARLSAQNQFSLRSQVEAFRMHRTYSRVVDILVILGTGGVLYFGGRYALGNEISPGTLVLFTAYLRDIYGSLEKFSSIFLNLAKAMASGERLLELVENDKIVQDHPNALPAPTLQGHIEFRDVTFGYKKGKEVLQGLNLRVQAGEMIAIIGHSGAGKSTLISLLMRFYDPQKGEILIDGQDVRRYTIKSLRDQMTIVLQDATLFNQTVRENIAFGKTGATEAEIVAAAKSAEAHDFIMAMPEGYDTMINEGGNNLSGGQRQRINIARAIIRNTPLVIMDEPVTGLDAKSEAKVNAAIHHLAAGKTTFIIAHKFSTIMNADKILLLDEGQAAYFGTHEELLRASKQYRELYELQYGWQRELRAELANTNGNGSTAKEVVAAI
ncbi:ABC transporter ATP-binding protein [candidate division KSB1 bacterium]|nr:ABC transporter ATP-binding protein [candidate division KSB1 bacterium]